MLKAVVYKLNGTKRNVKIFENTLGQFGNITYSEWREIRETYVNIYGENGVRFTLEKIRS